MLLPVTPIMSMTPSHKATINTVSYIAAFHAMHIDFATSDIVTTNKKHHEEFSLPIYSSSVAPLLGSFAMAACVTDNPIIGLILAQQSLQFAYVRQSFVNTAVENLVDIKIKKTTTHKNNQLSTWIAPTTK